MAFVPLSFILNNNKTMQNNRCGLHVGRCYPRQRSGSRGDPPLIFKIRGDPAAIIKSDPVISKNRFRRSKTSRMKLAEVLTSVHSNGFQGRGMPGSEISLVRHCERPAGAWQSDTATDCFVRQEGKGRNSEDPLPEDNGKE